MTIVQKGIGMINDVRAYWSHPAPGESVAYKEYVMLSVGWFGMRMATSFGFGFGINDAFTAMTLNMTHRDLIILGYICTIIGYVTAPINAYIIDNLRSRAGKYRVYIRLAIPAAALSMIALFFPYEKLSYIRMVVSLFLIGQIEGYIKGWYSTGVNNLVYVISPNSQERVRIMAVSSLVHNLAPSITGLFTPIICDLVADGNLYDMRTFRTVYPIYILLGTALSMTAYFGVKERIVQPVSEVGGMSFRDALRSVLQNKYFWIKCCDAWNDFLETSKNVLMTWMFQYGKIGSMSLYGILNTVTYNSSMWAMIISPALINRLGKRKFKILANTMQIFVIIGLMFTYKKSIFAIAIFYFLDRFFQTTEVIDPAIESDIRDYQHYLSGERIDGAFGVVSTYAGGAVGAVTNLFVPWIYKTKGFDGTDYSVLEVYDKNGNTNPRSVLYTLLDTLLKVSLAGSIIDTLPWFLYDISEAQQKGIIKTIRLRSAAEDRAAGLCDDEVYCEACEGIFEYREFIEKAPFEIIRAKNKDERAENRRKKKFNEEIEVAKFIQTELDRYSTPFGVAALELSKAIVNFGENEFFNNAELLTEMAYSLPKGKTPAEKTQRRDIISDIRSLKSIQRIAENRYSDGIKPFSPAALENAYNMPADNAEQRKARNAAIRKAKHERKAYARVEKPFISAKRNLILNDCYNNIDKFMSDYNAAKNRIAEKRAKEEATAQAAKIARESETQNRLRMKK